MTDGRVGVRFESGERETVTRDELRLGRWEPVPRGRNRYDGPPLPETPVAAGTLVWIRDGGYWFRAVVVTNEGRSLRVRWSGYPEPDRRTVSRSAPGLDQ